MHKKSTLSNAEEVLFWY